MASRKNSRLRITKNELTGKYRVELFADLPHISGWLPVRRYVKPGGTAEYYTETEFDHFYQAERRVHEHQAHIREYDLSLQWHVVKEYPALG